MSAPLTTTERTEEEEQRPVPLQSGDHLSRAEFERRYSAHPEIKKAELVEGVVYVVSPTHYEKHVDPHFNIITWLGVYKATTPGVRGGDNATVRLDLENEFQPDALLRLDPAVGGQSTIADNDYLEGALELVVEVAASSASYDMHAKRRVYARNGVPEYMLLLVYEKKLTWHVLREGVYVPLEPGEDGILRSEIFPGLWLDAQALLEGSLGRVLAVLQEGIASDAHGAFVERLQAQ